MKPLSVCRKISPSLRRTIACSALLVVSTSSTWVHAAPDAKFDAKAAFKQATALIDKKDCKGALPLLAKVYEATKSPNALLYSARCTRDEKRLPEAYDLFGAVIKESSDPKYEETRDAAAQERVTLEAQIARVTAANPPQGLVVELNGKPLPADKLGSVLALEPGNVVVTAKAAGYELFKEEMPAKEGSSLTIKIVLKVESQGSDTPTPTPQAQPTKPTSTGGGLRLAGIGVLGVGVVGVGTFVVTRILGDAKYSDLQTNCVEARCPQRHL
jgi:hypothetical protein